MRILHVCNPASVGGLESVVQGLSLGQSERGHSVWVLSIVELNDDIDSFLKPLTDGGVESIRINLPRRDYIGEVKSVRKVISSVSPDIVHFHGYRADILQSASVRNMGIPVVSTLHGFSRMGGLHTLIEKLQLYILKKSNGVVAVSPYIAREAIESGISSSIVHMIPNALRSSFSPLSRDKARFRLGLSPTATYAGWTGRLAHIKGCDILVRAVSKMQNADVQFVIVGDGPERYSLEKLADELGVKGRILFLGSRADAADLMKAYDVFVMSSRSEGTPMVLLEAMGSGIPAVVTSVGGVPDVVKNVSEDWMVKPESPLELAVALDLAFSDKNALTERGELAKNRIANEFGSSRWIDRHEQLYRSAIEVTRLTTRK